MSLPQILNSFLNAKQKTDASEETLNHILVLGVKPQQHTIPEKDFSGEERKNNH